MKRLVVPSIVFVFLFVTSCEWIGSRKSTNELELPDTLTAEIAEEPQKPLVVITIEKELQYDQYTLEDQYAYKDTVRVFQWNKISDGLHYIDSAQLTKSVWGILQNYKNRNGVAALVKEYHRNVYTRVSDRYEVERYQSVPLYLPNDTMTAERYGRDGSPVKYLRDEGSFARVIDLNIGLDQEWLVPRKYLNLIGDTVTFEHVVVVDRTNQNITSLEKVNKKWLVRSMNPATTGLHNPPYAHETPLGIFVVQEQKPKMIYLKDGSQAVGGFSPWASRFTNGGYIHGVPVNTPHTSVIEYSATLGTTPRSHMCVRNATSHAKFIYDWAPVKKSIVFVIE